MKVLQTLHGFLPEYRGGTELYVQQLARRLEPLGVTSAVLCGSGAPRVRPVVEVEDVEGLTVYRLHRSETYPERWDHGDSPHAEELFRKVLEQEAPDLVHVHHWKRLTRGLVITAAENGIPSVVTLHDLHATCPHGFRLRDGDLCTDPLPNSECFRCVGPPEWQDEEEVKEELSLHRTALERELALAREIFVPCRAHGEMVSRLLNTAAGSLTVTPLGDLEPVLAPLERERSGEGNSRLRFAHWGHLDDCKGVHLLLEAVGELTPEECSQIEVHLYGAPVTERFEGRLRRLAEGKPVFFHGDFQRRDLEKIEADVAVLPSLASESFSYVLNEAFSLGLPVLASRRGALEERVESGGLGFTPGDASDLAAKLRSLLEDPDLLAALRNGIPDFATPMTEHAEVVVQSYRRAVEKGAPEERGESRDRHLEMLKFRTRQAEQRSYEILEREASRQRLEKEKWVLEAERVDMVGQLHRIQKELVEREKENAALREQMSESKPRTRGFLGGGAKEGRE